MTLSGPQTPLTWGTRVLLPQSAGVIVPQCPRRVDRWRMTMGQSKSALDGGQRETLTKSPSPVCAIYDNSTLLSQFIYREKLGFHQCVRSLTRRFKGVAPPDSRGLIFLKNILISQICVRLRVSFFCARLFSVGDSWLRFSPVRMVTRWLRGPADFLGYAAMFTED